MRPTLIVPVRLLCVLSLRIVGKRQARRTKMSGHLSASMLPTRPHALSRPVSRRQLFPGGFPSPGGFSGKSSRAVSCPHVAIVPTWPLSPRGQVASPGRQRWPRWHPGGSQLSPVAFVPLPASHIACGTFCRQTARTSVETPDILTAAYPLAFIPLPSLFSGHRQGNGMMAKE